MPAPDIRRVTAGDVRPLRQALLRPHQRLDELHYPGDDDPHAVHVGAFADDRLVGIASLTPDGDAWRIRGVAVVAEMRGAGLGRALVEALLPHAHGRVWCSARTSALAFWRAMGFAPEDEPYDVPPIGEHVVMAKQQPAA